MSREMVVESGLWYISQGPAICDVGLRITLQRAISLGQKTAVSKMNSISKASKMMGLSVGASNEGSREA
jgi:hypothetical protein